MAITCYWGSGSAPAWRVMLALEVKKLPYESKLLSFSERQHKAPDYLALNPRGKVPTLVDGAFVIYESMAIVAYLDRKYPEPPLYGQTPEQAAVIARLISEHDDYIGPAALRVIRPLFRGTSEENADDIAAALPEIHTEFKRLDAILADSTWLAGDAISAADIVHLPGIQSLRRAAGKDAAAPLNLGVLPIADRYANVARWIGQMEALPGYDRTHPPHWR